MFDRILIGVDGRDGGRDAIALATQFAEPEAEFVLAHVCGTRLVPGRAADPVITAQIEPALELLKREQDAASVEARHSVWIDHNVGRGLHHLAEDWQADLLVIGSCHRGLLGRVFLGDDMLDSLNGAPCAVAIAPHGYTAAMRAFATIGVGSDGSAESDWALTVARDVASRFDAKVRAMAVVSLHSIPYGRPVPANWPEFVKRLLDSERRRLDALDDVEGDVSYGDPSEELARFGEQLDLLVVGSRSYGPVGRLFNGSTSNYLARRTRCPLLVLPRSAIESQTGSVQASQAEVGAR